MKFEQIGQKLRQIRKESGKKLVDVSRRSGYSTEHICAMERNKKMSIYSMCNILQEYGYEIEFVRKGQEE